MHKNILPTINATEQAARRDGHTLWYIHFRKLFALLFLMMASVGAWAQWTDPVSGVTYTPRAGSQGNTNETYDKACDGNPNTKFCLTLNGSAQVTIEASQAVYLKGYTITTANDNSGNAGRNPKNWTVAGSNTQNGTYTTIATVTNDVVLQDLNYAHYTFTCNSNTAYKFYRFTITATRGANVMQFSEFHPIAVTDQNTDFTFSTSYVIHNGTYYMGGTGRAGINTFNPSTCIWNHDGNYLKDGSGYSLYNANNTNNPISNTNRSTILFGGTGDGVRSGKTIQLGGSTWLNWDNGNTRWTRTNNTTQPNTGYLYYLTTYNYPELSVAPTAINGATTISSVGTTETYSPDITPKYRKPYTNYVYQNASHFYDGNNNIANAPAEETNPTYTWTLSANASGHATVDENGHVSYTTFYTDDTDVTLTLIARTASKTFEAITKTITFKGGVCTTPTITFSQSTKTVTISGKTDETIHYTTDDGYSGAAPTGSSTTYSVPINITQRRRIRAIATKANYRDSEVASLIVDNPNSMTPSTTYIGNVTAGNTVQLSYTLSGQPDADVIYDRVVYSSENSTVASVDQTGLVTANVAGTTNIVMTLYNLDGTVKSTQQIGIVVKNPFNDPNSLSVNSTNQTLNQGETWQIIATAHGEEPVYQKFKYEITGTSGIVSVNDRGLVKALSQGNTIVTVTAYNYGDVLSTLTQTINITVVKPTTIDGKTCVYALGEITNANGSYILMDDITVPETGNTSITGFTGSFDGNFKTISGLTQPLFATLNNANVYNVIVDNVDISRDGDVGAIANEAAGTTRIYNCGVLATNTTALKKGHSAEIYNNTYTSSSTITCTSNNSSAGSIVGYLHDNARVINCYSYADVSAVTNAGGIVGWTGGWITQANQTTNGQGTFVMNCMFYGDIKAGTTRTPITYVQYWNADNNARQTWTTYSYFRYKSIRTIAGLGQYNAMAAQEDMWLKRFKFYQSAVTNHRDLAAVYIFNDASRINEIAQWYIDENIAPWPILRKAGPQKSILERIIPNTGNANEGNLITNGKKLVDEDENTLDNDVTQRYNMNVGTNGYLTVNFNISGTGVASGGQTYSVQLPITDMDFEHFDYTWGKVVLPFANEFDGWTPDYAYICTGWEISSVTGGTQGTLTDYNFADRNCTAKDIYHATNNPIIFAQGGNWIVPYGVTSINVKAHFAKAYYLADANYDCQGGGNNAIGGTRPIKYHNQTVYTSAANAWKVMEDKVLPHDQALVLVGNYHYGLQSTASATYTKKGCTIISIDEDNDQQPDYGWFNGGTGRTNWPSVRWDFLPVYGFNMVQTGTGYPGMNIPVATGWFEMTETVICRTFEFEINDRKRSATENGKSNNSVIINGGYFQQIARCYSNTWGFSAGDNEKLSYIKLGGNVFVKELFPGNHSETSDKYNLRPIIVTGGKIEQCFMTGMGNKNEITTTNNNVRFYCAGGKIDKYISAYNGYPVVDATMKVDHARIGRFFGGGTSPKAALSGNINITMDNSYVDFFCGGPEFGDMGNGKTVTVNTTGSIFGEYYGAGFGGTALTRITNGDGQKTPFSVNGRGRLNYSASQGGFEVSYEMEALLDYQGNALWRYYDYRADLSMASTGNVTTTAKDCLFLNNFYGGGCQGKVNGTINSTLTNCDVMGSAFGGGYKAAATTIDVYPSGGNTWQVWDGTYKTFSAPVYPTPTQFTWENGTNGTYNGTVLYTNADMTQMGRVTNIINITINGGRVGQNVFGGGNESPSQKCTIVEVKNKCEVGGTIFGGGNSAPIGVSTKVTVDDSHVKGDVFGGGLGLHAVVSGNTTVWIKGIDCFIEKSVLGGGFGADVNGNTRVQIGGESLKTEYETTECNNN